MRKVILVIVCLCSIILVHAQERIEVDGLEGKGYYLETDWGKTYYEIYGEGQPLLILHGNGGSSKSKRYMTKEFAQNHLVIAMDARCHGNSTCPESDLDYFELAEDVYNLMEHLGHEKYAIWGHSDGGILGLILGYTHTDKIDRMLLSGANAQLQGLEPELIEIMSNFERIKDPMMKKHIKLMYDQKPIPVSELKKVSVPVMLMVGDRDAVKLDHTLDMFKALPMAQLCVLPGTTHFIENEKKEQLIYWFNEFEKPFKKPSTVEIAEQMAKVLFVDH